MGIAGLGRHLPRPRFIDLIHVFIQFFRRRMDDPLPNFESSSTSALYTPQATLNGSEVLQVFDPADMKIFHTGTFNANPVTMVAGEVSLRELSPERIERMNRLRDKLQSELSESAKKHGLPMSITHHESCMNIFMSESVPVSSVMREDEELMDKFHIACLNHGLLIAPRGLVALSTVLTDDDIAAAVERADAALQDVAAESG